MINLNEHICADEVSMSKRVAELPSDEVLLRICNIFNALQSETRLKILFLLSGSDLCVRELELALKVSQSAISHSLRILRQLDLVRVRKEGRFAVYYIADEHVQQLINTCNEHVMEE
ncbi:metalloregulator ArsR/SmtB family transcription factor [Methanolobus sp. ZRKC3]|uniref:ArsR/SmtB family transcription factor n=1 Tax=Methanolobus sp. ZRKC3 TaxID=3125786 RepID=UPI003247B4D3